MKKKILSLLCALIMTVTTAEPIFAADDPLYESFKKVDLGTLRQTFLDNFTSFEVSENGKKYTESQKCMLILDAWQQGFSSFDELDENVTEAAEELQDKLDDTTLLGLTGHKSATINASSITETSPNNTFKYKGEEYIVLDMAEVDGEPMLFVMTKAGFGAPAIDPETKGRWLDEMPNGKLLLPYALTNTVAFGKTNTWINKTLPEEIIEHVDIFHKWHTEPGSGVGYTTETTLIAPISILSLTEQIKYANIIGKDSASADCWTRTPVLGTVKQHFVVNKSTFAVAGSTSYNGRTIRPAFYLKSSFFKEEKLQHCGANVAAYLDTFMKESDLDKLYSDSEREEIFPGLSVTPLDIDGKASAGQVLTAGYEYSGDIAVIDVKITWERSLDAEKWETIPNAVGNTYQFRAEDSEYYIRAAYEPTFDSVLLKHGAITYSNPLASSGIAFRDVKLSELRKLFLDNFEDFDISSKEKKYNDTEKSMIILDAYRKGYSTFAELNANVTESASILDSKKDSPTLSDESGYNRGYSDRDIEFTSPDKTEPGDVFEIDGKSFIVLSKLNDNGEDLFYVMAKESYGYAKIDDGDKARWDDTEPESLPYKLTNQMAYGTYSSNLPESILKHLDIFHEWDIEPGSAPGHGSHYTYIAPISVISVTDYNIYMKKIGIDGFASRYWTRTSANGSSTEYYAIQTSKKFSKISNGKDSLVRPVFCLKASFFKEEKMKKAGVNVSIALNDIMSRSELENIYDNEDIKNVFGSLSVTPGEIVGDAIVGETLQTDYTYSGNVDISDVKITWEKSLDKTNWEPIPGATGKSYQLRNEDAEYYIRAVFAPTFDSISLRDGEATYAEKAGTVYQSVQAFNAVKDINSATEIAEVRSLLEEHSNLFLCDHTADKFSDGAVLIFMQDEADSVNGVKKLYSQAIALDALATATDDKTALENIEFLLLDVPEFGKLNEEQEEAVVSFLKSDAVEKTQVSGFIGKAKEIIMLERFNNAERGDALNLIKEYSEHLKELGADVSGFSEYQLEKVANSVAVTDFGTNLDDLLYALKVGIAEATETTVPGRPTEGNTGKPQSGGFVPPATEKPEASGQIAKDLFSDLQSVSWATVAINNLAEKGILSGTGDGTFSPDRYVTRNEFVTMLVNAFGIEMSDAELPFEDILADSWSAKYIAAAVNAGIISGIDETHFGDGMNITRQDVAVIAERLMKYKGFDLRASSLVFSDSDEISDYAVEAVAKICYNKIMSGLGDNIFAPKDGTTRAMAAVIVYNLVNYCDNQNAQFEENVGQIITKSLNDKYALVYSLGILKDEFATDSKITRGELAAALTVFGNYVHSKAEIPFGDVPNNHKYYKDISAVYQNNLMAGVTEDVFMPDEAATYGDALNALIAASGYTRFPGGKSEAESAIKKEYVNAQNDDALTPDMAKKMFFAALEIRALDFANADTHRISEKNILNLNFNAYKEKGTVTAVSGMSIGGREEIDDDKIIITVGSKDYLYYGNGADYSDYLGYNVTYYYQEVDGSYQILNMMLSPYAEEPLKLSFEQILRAEKDLSAITYANGNRTKEAEIARNADFIYNGRRCYSISSEDLVPNNGYITLVDTDRDDEYDVVKIDSYEYIIVAQVSIADRSVLDRITWETHKFVEGKDADKISITKNGRYIKLDYIMPGDVLGIARSRDGKIINAYVSDRKVTGNIRGISAEDYEITIDETTLKTVRDFDFDGLSNNMSVTVGVDWEGYAIGYYSEMSNADLSYGFLYDIKPNDDDDRKYLFILTEGNEYIRLNTSEKPQVNGVKYTQDAIEALSPQLIAYTLDADGNVKKIYTSETEQGEDAPADALVLNKHYADKTPSFTYNTFGMTINFGYIMPKKAVVFDITMDNGKLDKELSFVTNIGAQTIPSTAEAGDLYIYNSDMLKVSNLCVYKHKPKGGNTGFSESFNSQSFLLNKIVQKYDANNDEVVVTCTGYQSGNSVQYTLSETLLKEISTSQLSAGDVLLIWTSGSEITRFRRIYAAHKSDKFSGDTDKICNYGDYNYLENGEIAQHVIEVAEGKNSSALASNSRMVSVYGNIDLIYKSEAYAYPVIKMTLEGSDTSSAFTMDGSTIVYSYDATNNTVRVLDPSSVNVSAKRAAMTVRYGNVRDVIIYEY